MTYIDIKKHEVYSNSIVCHKKETMHVIFSPAALEEPHPSSHHTPQLPLLLCIGLSVPALLLLLVGLLQWRKHQAVNRGTENESKENH